VRLQGAASVEHNVKTMLPVVLAKLTDVEQRLRDMDAMGVDIQVVSPSPTQYYYWADPELAREHVRLQNEQIAELCARHPDRFAGLGMVALQHPELSVEQLEHGVRTLGLRGVEVSSSVNGLELANDAFARFWRKAEELGCLVFLHPLGTSLGERVNQHYLANIVGQPLETTIALSQLIFGGVLDRHPGVKICAAHGGGYLPSYVGRSDHGYRVRPESQQAKRAPSAYLKQLYFDNLVYTPEAIRHLVNEVGASQLVVGTDYPFDMGSYDVHALVEAVPGLSESERAAILGGNALRLLGLSAPRSERSEPGAVAPKGGAL
jgi:aminocarboxymuconate-semialdehyde decarboxylase